MDDLINAAMGSGTLGSGTLGIGMQQSQLMQQAELLMRMQAQQVDKVLNYECGVLYLNGYPLPDEWRGAYIDRIESSLGSGGGKPRWIFNFYSKWSKDAVLLHLDAEELSGKEAKRVAETYKEALNQRRVG